MKILRKIKCFFQKLFFGYSNEDLWSLDYHLAKIILPRLQAFRNQPLNGFPVTFSEYHPHEWRTEEEYNQEKLKGNIIGGEMDKWLEYLDEMIFAFKFVLIDMGSHPKLEKEIKNKYGDWEKQIPENEIQTNNFKYYYDYKLHNKLHEKCQNGLLLFGKYFRNLWD